MTMLNSSPAKKLKPVWYRPTVTNACPSCGGTTPDCLVRGDGERWNCRKAGSTPIDPAKKDRVRVFLAKAETVEKVKALRAAHAAPAAAPRPALVAVAVGATPPAVPAVVAVKPPAPSSPPSLGPTSDPAPAPKTYKLGSRDEDTGRLILNPKRTLPSAKAFVLEHFTNAEGVTLVTYRGVPFVWKGNRFEPIEPAYFRNKLYPWLDAAVRSVKNPKTGDLDVVPFEANKGTVDGVVDAIMAATTATNIEPPCWLEPKPGDRPADEILCGRTKNLHLPTLEAVPASPRLFNTCALDFDYDRDATEPAQWMAFLREVLGDDESILLLQQWFGYCLTQNTRQQKILFVKGPTRSGKGIIESILRKLVGEANCCSPTGESLAGEYGLWPLIGKSLAVIGDARFGGPKASTVVERLLLVSGEGAVTVERKYLPAVTMKLPTRFMILSNDLPKLSDASGALAGRFLMLITTKSFLGREDFDLSRKLSEELPGILQWAVEGWHILRSKGRFVEPASSRAARGAMEDSLSPIGAFVAERCIVAADQWVWISDIYDAWNAWCKEVGRYHPGPATAFGRELHSAVATIRKVESTGKLKKYLGIGLRPIEPD